MHPASNSLATDIAAPNCSCGQHKAVAVAELAALNEMLDTPVGLLLRARFDGEAQVLFDESCAGFDMIARLPTATVRGDELEGTVVEARVGRVTFTARWPRHCSVASHAYVGRTPRTYWRETRGQSGRCRRCGSYVVPSFDPGAELP